MRLYELAAQYRDIGAALDDSGGELTEEIAEALGRLDGELEGKVDAIGALVAEAEAEAEAFKSERGRLYAREKAALGKAARLRGFLLGAVLASGKGKVKGRVFAASPRKASVPSVEWAYPDGRDIPLLFRRVRVELDGKAAHDALKAGTLPDGFRVTHAEYLDLR